MELFGYYKTRSDVTYYINGQFVSKKTYSFSEYTQNSLPLLIGAVNNTQGIGRYFNGLIDELRIYNRALNSSEVAELYTTSLPVSTLQATTISPNAIQLSWDKMSGVKGYRIQRKDGDCSSTNPWSTLTDINAYATTFQNWYLTANTAYSYRIASYYGGQILSPYSTCASATTGLAGTPRSPGSIRAISQSNSQVDLHWWDNSENETHFEIYRKANGGSWTLIKTIATNMQRYRDTTATENSNSISYSYDVSACNTSGCSIANPLPVVVPFSPTNLAATIATRVKLTWNDNSNNETAFQVWRKNGGCASTTPWVAIAFPAINATAYTDSSAMSGTVYAYKIRARTKAVLPYSNGSSSFSGCVSTTAP
jgi:hypothetical protein